MNHPQADGTVAAAFTDEALMQGILAGEQGALDRLHSRYQGLLRGIIFKILPNEADTEEALQDVFVEIWRRIGNFDARKGKPLGWIICLARRRAIDHRRKLSRRAATEVALCDHDEEGQNVGDSRIAGVSTSGDEASMNDLRRLLTAKMDTLPVEQSRVLRLIYFKEMSQRQVAAHTGIPLGTIKTRKELALSKLAREMMPLRLELC